MQSWATAAIFFQIQETGGQKNCKKLALIRTSTAHFATFATANSAF